VPPASLPALYDYKSRKSQNSRPAYPTSQLNRTAGVPAGSLRPQIPPKATLTAGLLNKPTPPYRWRPAGSDDHNSRQRQRSPADHSSKQRDVFIFLARN